MTSTSGGHDARSRGRRGHNDLKGRALSASRINLSENFADSGSNGGAETVQENSVKNLESSFKRPQMEDVVNRRLRKKQLVF